MLFLLIGLFILDTETHLSVTTVVLMHPDMWPINILLYCTIGNLITTYK